MQNKIYTVAKHLERMCAKLNDANLDYEIGVVTFHVTPWDAISNKDIQVTPLTKNVGAIRHMLENIKCTGDEKALNALMTGVRDIKFRKGASRHFLLVTDEYVDGDYTSAEVFAAMYNAKIRVDVIGADEPFERALAARTGGVWIDIRNLTM